MTREEIISGLQMTMDLIQFDPGTGNVRPIYELNDLDKTTYVACKEAIKALKAQGTCEDAVSRQTFQKELALYPIDDVTSEDEAGYNRAINDVQKMVLHLPSAQPERKTGNWIGTEYDGYADGNPVYYEWKCSACGCVIEDDEPTWNFCPNCGADMRGEQDD